MKNIKLLFAMLFIAGVFSACGGDHNAKNGQDTAKNSYQVPPDSSKLDTGKVTSPDNSASGGANLDTSKAKKDADKK